MSIFQLGSPMWRFTERMVRSTFVTAWRFATSPTSTSPFLAKATTLGVVREPSEFAMTSGSPPLRTETTELVVPRSMPTARAMFVGSFYVAWGGLTSDGARLAEPLSKQLSGGRSTSVLHRDLGHNATAAGSALPPRHPSPAPDAKVIK